MTYTVLINEIENILHEFLLNHYSEDDVHRLPYLYGELKKESMNDFFDETKLYHYLEDCKYGNTSCDYLYERSKDLIDKFAKVYDNSELMLIEMFEYSDELLINLLNDIKNYKDGKIDMVKKISVELLLSFVECLEVF